LQRGDFFSEKLLIENLFRSNRYIFPNFSVILSVKTCIVRLAVNAETADAKGPVIPFFAIAAFSPVKHS
jgi:hypothetical protein